VVDVFQHVANDLQAVSLRDADGDDTRIISTDEHPYFVIGHGWTNALGLAVGDQVLSANGGVMTVVSNTDDKRPEGVVVYNFAVEGNHTYFVNDDVGDGWAWVHNTCVYYTKDANGRVSEALALVKRADLGSGTGTTRAARGWTKKFGNAGDDAGHILGSILGGKGGLRSSNIVALEARLNRGKLAAFEKAVAGLVSDHQQVVLKIHLSYSGLSKRPDGVFYVVESLKGTLAKGFLN
jgi:hypothetical protein